MKLVELRVATLIRESVRHARSVVERVEAREASDSVALVRAWLPKVGGSKRNDVIASCKQNGVDLAPRPVVKPPKPDAGVVDCVKEPMACQH